MFFNLTWRNAKRSRSENLIYFLTMITAVAMFYIVLSLGQQDVIRFLSEIESDAVERLLTNLLPTVYLCALLFVFFLVVFANKYQLECRSRELGLYLMFGISNDKRSLKAAFYTAIQDDCIRKNPFDFQLNTVIEDDTEPKVPLTPAQEESFLSFAQNDKVYQKYYDELIILLGTGLRISELCGLTDTDINFENRIINVDHQLLRSAETGYYIETPKTKSGIRQIPMSEKVYEAFNRVLKRRRGAKAVTIDGYSNFLFLNRDGYPKTATNYDGMFRGLAKKYNKYHEEALPKVMTPHTLRHTFCTNMANAGMNPKALQYIMGHSNITMTLNYYAHATFDSAKAEMLRIAA